MNTQIQPTYVTETIKIHIYLNLSCWKGGTHSAGDEHDYDVELADNADPQDFLRQAMAAGLPMTRFEQAGATLHDIFVALAGDEEEAPPAQPARRAEAAE